MTSQRNSEHDAERMRANDRSRIQDLEHRLTALVTSSDRLELLGAILDAFDNTIVVTDPNQADNPIIYVNGGFEKLTGYGPDEVIGQNCRFLQGEDRDQEGVRQLRAAVQLGESTDVELRNYRQDGTMFWNHLYLSPVYDEEGKLVLFLGVQNDAMARKEATEEVRRARDTLEERIRERTRALDESNQALRLEVQARERAEREVRASESRLLDVLDHLLTFVAVLDPDGTLQYVNRAALDASDVALAAVIGLPFAETPWWRHDAAVQRRLREAIRKVARGETQRFDTQVRMSKDRFLTVDFMLAPVRDARGNVSSLVASAANVTEREETKGTLQQNEQRLRLALDGAELGIWSRNLQSGRMWFDARCQDLFGVPAEAEAGAMLDLVHPDDLPALERAILHATNPQEPENRYMAEHRFYGVDGEVRWMAVRGQCRFMEENGERVPAELFGVVQDVTERERAREALQETTERLQLLVSEARDYAVVITDPAGEWNAGAERVMGQREAEVGRHDLIFTPHDTQEHTKRRCASPVVRPKTCAGICAGTGRASLPTGR